MSRPMADTPTRRPRRQFTDEFKTGVVRLVLDEGPPLSNLNNYRDISLAIPMTLKNGTHAVFG